MGADKKMGAATTQTPTAPNTHTERSMLWPMYIISNMLLKSNKHRKEPIMDTKLNTIKNMDAVEYYNYCKDHGLSLDYIAELMEDEKKSNAKESRFENIARDYYTIAMGCVPKVNIDWESAEEKVERCDDWVKRVIPEVQNDIKEVNRITDELWYYAGDYQEIGFIKGFALAMELMTKHTEEKNNV